jgi:hypothetical protein
MTLPKIITDRFGTQADVMRSLAMIFIIGLTFALAWLNVGGAWASSGNLALTICILFAELLAAICMGLIILARTWPRKLVGSLIFAALIWVCLENGLAAIKISFSDVFVADSQTLRDRSALAAEEAAQLQAAATGAVQSTGGELERVRSEIADLKIEQETLANNSPEGIERAQRELQAKGLYNYRVDGIADAETEKARRERGEQVQRELAKLKVREEGLMGGAAPPAVTATTQKRLEQIELDAKAREVSEKLFWSYFLLFGLEGARSFGVWAFLMNATSRNETRRQELLDDIAHADLEARLARARAGIPPGVDPVELERQEATPVTTKADVTPAPAPVEEIAPEATPDTTETVVTPPPVVEEPPAPPVVEQGAGEGPVLASGSPVVELEPLPGPPEPPVPGRKGGLATQFSNRGDADPAKIPVGDWAARDGHITEQAA